MFLVDGLGWYLLWMMCPDDTNVVKVDKKKILLECADKKGWIVKTVKLTIFEKKL